MVKVLVTPSIRDLLDTLTVKCLHCLAWEFKDRWKGCLLNQVHRGRTDVAMGLPSLWNICRLSKQKRAWNTAQNSQGYKGSFPGEMALELRLMSFQIYMLALSSGRRLLRRSQPPPGPFVYGILRGGKGAFIPTAPEIQHTSLVTGISASSHTSATSGPAMC
jgi:hypothetical protein